jgi:hypothetical protein
MSNAFSTDVCFVCADKIPDGKKRTANKQTVNFMAELIAGIQYWNSGNFTAKTLGLGRLVPNGEVSVCPSNWQSRDAHLLF